MTLKELIEPMKSDAKILILRGEESAIFYGHKWRVHHFFEKSAERARRMGVTPYERREARLLTVTEDGLFVFKIVDREMEGTGNER